MNTIAIFGGEMEAPAVRKWPELMGEEREREREKEVRMKKNWVVRVITPEINITDEKSISNILRNESFH